MTFEPKYRILLENNSVRRWYENAGAGSKITADVYLRTLGLFCELNNTDPQKIVNMAKESPRKFKEDFMDFVRSLEKQGKAGSYIVRFKKTLKSWLKFNDIDLKLDVKIKGEYESPRIANERVPSKEELAIIIRKASTRGRVAIALMAFSGLRPESLGNYDGTDGIRLGDLKELNLDTLEFEKTPTILIVRSSLSKAKHQYFTFIPEEGITYIKEYLMERKSKGEKFTYDTPLLIFEGKGVKSHIMLRTQLITRDIREAIRNADLNMRPYVLRGYFATALDIAESKGLISHPWRMFIMGHKGDIEARYSTNKRLPPDMIEEMREAYNKCIKYIETLVREPGVNDAKIFFMKQLLLAVGFKEDDIEKIDLEHISDEDFQKILRDRVVGAMTKNGNKQKVISINDVEKFIEQGYEVVTNLGNGKIVIKLPF
jgi:integrase